EINHGLRFINRNQNAAGSLRNPPDRIGFVQSRHEQVRNRNSYSGKFRRQVGRKRSRQSSASGMQFVLAASAQFLNGDGVVAEFDAGLDRFPIFQRFESAIAVHQRRGNGGLSNVSVRPGYEETAEHEVTRCTEAANRSSIPSSRFAFTETRSRAVPGGTAGGRTD